MEVKLLKTEELLLPENWKGKPNDILELSNKVNGNEISPILVDEDSRIIDGVKRYLVCVLNDITAIPVIVQRKTGKVKIVNINPQSIGKVA